MDQHAISGGRVMGMAVYAAYPTFWCTRRQIQRSHREAIGPASSTSRRSSRGVRLWISFGKKSRCAIRISREIVSLCLLLCLAERTQNLIAVRQLKRSGPISQAESMRILFQGIDRRTDNFQPIFKMAGKLFTHLGVACTCHVSVVERGDPDDNHA